MLAIWSLTQREIVRFLRQRSRLTGALLQPVIFWILFGTGLSRAFRMPGGNSDLTYQAYFLPGIAAMIVMFTAIFSAISIIQDRNEGFLQGVLVSPASRLSIVLGKLGGGTLLAVLQALLFLIGAPLLASLGLAPAMNLPGNPLQWLGAIGMLALMGVGLCGLGYLFAWKLDSIQGFHAIMSVLLFPMWLLSGAFFPAEGSGWLRWLIAINPLTYSVAGLRRVLAVDAADVATLPSMQICLAVSIVFAAVCIAAAVWLTRRTG